MRTIFIAEPAPIHYLCTKNIPIIMKKLLFYALIFASAFTANARDARAEIEARPERAAGVYFAYPTDLIETDSKIPKGYEPFYITHYGRHGSRYLINDNDYERVMQVLDKADKAGALSDRGKLLKAQMDTIWAEAQGRGGELSPLGARQHHGIGKRMAEKYPAVFDGDARVTAVSTQVMRCAHSMFNFINGLKEVNPALDIPMESAKRQMKYLSYQSPESSALNRPTGPYYQDYKRFKASKSNPDRIISTLFSDPEYVSIWVDKDGFVNDLYWLASDLQNMETDIDLLPLFTTDELFDLWQYANFSFFARASTYPRANGTHVANARNLLTDFIDNADAYLADGSHGATLRFGHDSNIIPFLGLMRVDGCFADTEVPDELCSEYADYYVSPMATNIQFVFFRPAKGKKGDILVQVLHNERAAGLPIADAGSKGLYRWVDLRAYLTSLLK